MLILLADDHPLYLEAVRLRLQRLYPDACFREAETLDATLAASEEGMPRPDLVLSDLNMPGMEGIAGVSRILAAFPGVPFALMSGSARRKDVMTAVQLGVRGFLPKTMNSDAFAAAVSLLLAGGTYLPTELVLDEAEAEAPPPNLLDRLTPREKQVLVQLAAGASNKEIAREMNLAEVTIKLHVRQILKKIQSRNRSEAAAVAARAGLI